MDLRSKKRTRPTSEAGTKFHSELYDQGYCVLPSHVVVPDTVTTICAEKLGSRKASQAIFNHNELSRRNDSKRRQTNLPRKSKPLRNFVGGIEAYLRQQFPNLTPADWVVLTSEPGCQAQAAHTDYVPTTSFLTTGNVPVNVLVALQDGTKLYVWPRSHTVVLQEVGGDVVEGQPIEKKPVFLQKGDLLLFSGLLVHAGAEYPKRNCRLHCYLDAGHRPPNRTFLVEKHASPAVQKMIKIA